MAYGAKILADSISPTKHRLTTFEITFPRPVLAEFNTHRVFSRNSASSRAIPVVKQLRRILDDPFIPVEFGTNQPGMQASVPLEGAKLNLATKTWLNARDDAMWRVIQLIAHPKLGFSLMTRASMMRAVEEIDRAAQAKDIPEGWLNVHKQIANRLLEPFMWHTVIVTATEWSNFFALRAHKDAQPEIRVIAEMMEAAYSSSSPVELGYNDWHLPLVYTPDREQLVAIDDEFTPVGDLIKICTGRCARISYLTHAGTRDTSADISLHSGLIASGHMSPSEHAARPFSHEEWEARTRLSATVKIQATLTSTQKAQLCDHLEFDGNFRGFHQYRKDLLHENDYSQILAVAAAK